MTYNQGVTRPVTVVEVEPFSTKAKQVWGEEEKLELIGFVAHNPEIGDVIPGTGGVRKMRWARRGIGKRGGVRIVYYYHNESMPLFLLTLYPKTAKSDLTAKEKRTISGLVVELRKAYGTA